MLVCWNPEKMGKSKDMSDFDKGQIVMARRLGQSISETAALVGCSRSVVVNTYQKWVEEGEPVNRRKGNGRPRLIDARGERRLARVVQSNKKATVAQIAEKVNAGSDRKVSEHTVHRSLLRMGLRSPRVKVVKLTALHSQESGSNGHINEEKETQVETPAVETKDEIQASEVEVVDTQVNEVVETQVKELQSTELATAVAI